MDQRKGESAAFWHQKYDEVKEELEEYQSSSRELEQELETQLAQSEKKRKELEATLERVKEENDGLKSKLSQVVSESQKQINQLQKDLNHYQATNESLSRAIRELEQSNDDLERAKRALIASLEDFEGRLNQQIEKNVLLENELGDKEELEVVVQRLKDEARDLKYELTLQRQKEPKNVSTSHDNRRSSLLEGCSPPVRSPSSNSVVGVNNTSVNSKPRALSCHSSTVVDGKLNCSPSPMKQPRAVPQRLTPTSRITALSAVNDLFRKVGPIEPKLDSCRR